VFSEKKLIYNFQIKKKFGIFFMIFYFFPDFFNFKKNHFFKLRDMPRGVQHAKSAGMWGHEPFSNNFFFRNVIQTFFLQGRKSYLSIFKIALMFS